MEVIQYFLVSIFLFCNKTNSDKLTASFLQKSVTSSSFGITSTVNDELSKYFPNSKIPTLLRYISINNYQNDESRTDDYTNPKNRLSVENPLLNQEIIILEDDMKNCNKDIKAIYDNVVYLFVDKWEHLLTIDNLLTNYPKNLEFDKKTMNLINRSMTELIHLQRRSEIKVFFLATAYLFTCDLANRFKIHREMNVIQNKNIKEYFKTFLEYYKSYRKRLQQMDMDDFLLHIEENLEKSLSAIAEKVKTSFNMTVQLIKNYAILIKSKDPTVKNLQEDSFQNDLTVLTLSEVTLSHSWVNNFPEAIKKHLSILKRIILRMYGFMINHFELSAELCKHNLDENDKKTIEGFRTYIHFFMPLFIDRYFELDGSLDLDFIEKILKLLDFVFPEASIYIIEELSIWNYKEKNEDAEMSLDKYILSLSNDALNALLDFFKVTNKDLWKINRVGKVKDFKDEKPEKEKIINLMDENFKIGMKGLVLFIMDFDVGLELFEKSAEGA